MSILVAILEFITSRHELLSFILNCRVGLLGLQMFLSEHSDLSITDLMIIFPIIVGKREGQICYFISIFSLNESLKNLLS